MIKTIRFSQLVVHLIPSIILAVCLTQTVSAASTRISGDASQFGQVASFQIASTGDYAVYFAYKEDPQSGDNTPYLYSVPLNGGAPANLTSPLPLGSSVNYKISADSSRVIYVANQESITVPSLYSVPITGGTPVRLSKTGVKVATFELSPDSQWVVFGSYDINMKVHLYRAAINGGTNSAVEITPAGAQPTMYDSFTISPDSSHILYTGNMDPLGGWGIYSLPITGSSYVRISKPVNQNWVMEYLVTPDSQQVVYRYEDESTNPATLRLYAVPIDGPDTKIINLSGTVVAGWGASVFKISPDGRYVVFSATKDVADKYELYSYFLATRNPMLTNPVKLNIPIADNKDVVYDSFRISPDSSRVVYFANQSAPHQLFSVPINGPITANIQLNQPVAPSLNIAWNDAVVFSSDSAKVIFTSMQDTPDFIDLYSVPAAGPASAAVKLNPTQVKAANNFAQITSPQVSPDGRLVFYRMSTTLNRADLYQSPINGPASQTLKLSEVSVDNGYITSFTQVPDGMKIVYRATQASLLRELYMTERSSFIFLPVLIK